MAYTVSALTDYVEVNKDVLIRRIVLGDKEGDTIANLSKQLGIKTRERMNYLNVDPIFQDGTNCGFTPSGNTDFSEREIAVSPIKVQDQYCDRVLLGKFAEYLVKTSADKNAADMPFEAEILDEVIAGIHKEMERLVWQGDKADGDLIDGFLTIAEGADSASTVAVSVASGATKIEALRELIMNIPEELLDDAVIFVSPAFYRALVFELVDENLYHFNPTSDVENVDIVLPGTNIRIHKTMGLSGVDNKLYCSVFKNMVYGTDLMNDEEKIRFWYEDNDELFKYNIRWNMGVNTLYPDAVIVATIA